MNIDFMKELSELLKKHGAELYVDEVNYQDGCHVEFGYKTYVQCGFYREQKKFPLRTHIDGITYTGFDAQMVVDQYNGVYL